jgi:hypothetical protein
VLATTAAALLISAGLCVVGAGIAALGLPARDRVEARAPAGAAPEAGAGG